MTPISQRRIAIFFVVGVMVVLTAACASERSHQQRPEPSVIATASLPQPFDSLILLPPGASILSRSNDTNGQFKSSFIAVNFSQSSADAISLVESQLIEKGFRSTPPNTVVISGGENASTPAARATGFSVAYQRGKLSIFVSARRGFSRGTDIQLSAIETP